MQDVVVNLMEFPWEGKGVDGFQIGNARAAFLEKGFLGGPYPKKTAQRFRIFAEPVCRLLWAAQYKQLFFLRANVMAKP